MSFEVRDDALTNVVRVEPVLAADIVRVEPVLAADVVRVEPVLAADVVRVEPVLAAEIKGTAYSHRIHVWYIYLHLP